MKTIFYIINAVIIIFAFIFCYHYYEKDRIITSYIEKTPVIETFKKAAIKGETLAYNKLKEAYKLEPYEEELIYYSFLIANKCQYPPAYYDVYYELRHIEILGKKDFFDKELRTFMIEYLKKGAALGDKQSKLELGRLYMQGKYLPKDTILGKKFIRSCSN